MKRSCGTGCRTRQLAGVYSEEEMAQADRLDAPPSHRGGPKDLGGPLGPQDLPRVAAQLDPDPVDEPPAPEGYVRVVLMEDTPTKRPGTTRYTITLSNGDIVTTINDMTASVALAAMEKRTPIQVETRESRYGTDLVKITEYKAPPKAAEPATPASLPLTADDIPFLWLLPVLLAVGSACVCT
jgi:hypothetical protein